LIFGSTSDVPFEEFYLQGYNTSLATCFLAGFFLGSGNMFFQNMH
jgi:hypothetical protein